MRNTAKNLLAFLLVSCLLFGAVGTAFAEEAQDNEMNQLLSDIQELMTKYGPEIAPEVLGGTTEGTGRYTETEKFSHYVAIGDNTTVGDKGYVPMVAKALGVTYKNLAKTELLVEEVNERVLTTNAAEIKKADLITLNFSINRFACIAIDEVLDKESTYLNWEKYVAAEGVAEIKATLSRLRQYLINSGVEENIPFLGSKVEALVTAAESFAYGTLVYANVLPQVLDQIHALNPDAIVVVVGMDNPLSGAAINLSSGEPMDLGGFIGKLIGMTDRCAQTAAISRPYVRFVSAPNAENPNDNAALSETQLIRTYLRGVDKKALPTEAGHAYLAERVQTAFRKMGDVDCDGSVSYNDALLALRASIGMHELDADSEFVADVDGMEGLSYNDALKILRASIGMDTIA